MRPSCEAVHTGKRPTERDPLSQRKSPVQEEEKLKLAVKDLTACQLQRLKLSPACEGAQQGSSAHGYDFREDDLEDNQPFPTLQHVLEAVDPSVGFNVEIKCPMQFRVSLLEELRTARSGAVYGQHLRHERPLSADVSAFSPAFLFAAISRVGSCRPL